jgi:predicted membrane chloride channel (bestrophin family)
MEASVIPGATTVLVAAVVAIAIATTLAVVAAILAYRRYRRLRRNLGALLVARLRELLAIQPTPAGVRAARSRFALARSVGAAEHAVKMAIAANAPIGDLARLCSEVRGEADRLDYGLRIAQRAIAPSADMAHMVERAHELSATAARIQQSAAGSVSAMAKLSGTRLVDDVHIESLATRAGTDQMHRVS